MELEGLCQLKNPVTSSGIERMIVQLVADLSWANLISDYVSNIMNSAYRYK
jgi:hypothetical protein